MSTDSEAQPTLANERRAVWSFAGLLLLGALLGAWPHLVRWVMTGQTWYVADSDGLLYEAWVRDAALTSSWSLTDAIHRPSGPMMHPWVLFVPPAKLARGLGVDVGLVWRILAGAGIAAGLFAAVRPSLSSPGTAALVAAFLLCDGGLLFGQLGLYQAKSVASLVWGDASVLSSVPRLFPHLRVPPPALAVGFFLAHLGAVVRLRLHATRANLFAASVSFGMLFYVYFYFWTVAGLALVLAFLLDRGGRRSYFQVAFFGGLIGLPTVVEGMLVKRATPPDWLLRTDKFAPMDRFAELLIPKVVVRIWVVTAWFVFKSARERVYAWCLVAAGLVLVNQQVLTKLQIENFHWSYAYGLALSALVAILVAPWLERWVAVSQKVRWALAAVLVMWIGLAFGLRTLETTRSRETLWVDQIARDWTREAPAMPEGAVVAGDPDALAVAAARSLIDPLSARLVEYSAKATDLELDERLLLNWYLSGISREQAHQRADAPAGTWSREAAAIRQPALAAAQQSRRHGLVDQIWGGDPLVWIERFQVRFLVLPRGVDPPDSLVPRLTRLDADGSTWRFWEIRR